MLVVAVLACATGMGTLFARSMPLPLRAALGLGVWGEALFLLAAIGQLRAVPIVALAGLSVVGCLLSARPLTRPSATLSPLSLGEERDYRPVPASDDDTACRSSRKSSQIDQSHMYIRS